MVENVIHIRKAGITYALLIRGDKSVHCGWGPLFVTAPEEPLQVGLSRYSRGHIIKPHRHRPIRREITRTYEVIHLEQGDVLVRLFDDSRERVAEVRLSPGDTIVLIEGYHSLEFLDDSVLLEVKQGPYPGKELDKEYMEGVPEK
mgnify:CR=1 FL=1